MLLFDVKDFAPRFIRVGTRWSGYRDEVSFVDEAIDER